MAKILIVEDEVKIARFVELELKYEGYTVEIANDGRSGLEKALKPDVDLVLLDIMLPGLSGIEVCRRVRMESKVPIIMLTAKDDVTDKVAGLDMGADDYMTKPFDEDELLWRIKALLRRAQIVNERRLCIGKVTLEYDSLTVSRENEIQTLPQKEFYLLYKLLSNSNIIFTRIQLMDEIWGMDSETADTTVNVHINRLRKRFENYPEFDIIAIRGIGYKAVKNFE